jgi:hypothetical protein
LKEKFLNNFKGGKFDNVIPEALKDTLKNKTPLSEDLVAEKADESGSVNDSEDDGEESPAKRILFEDGDSLHDFFQKFIVFSPEQKAQLCLTNPPWSLLQAAKHQHDANWGKNE